MSDPGTTYRTREEVQRMRSTQDPIRGLQSYIEQWGLATEAELKVRLQSPFIYSEFTTSRFSKLTRRLRPSSMRPSRRLSNHPNRSRRTFGPTSTIRALSRRSCVEGSGRKFIITRHRPYNHVFFVPSCSSLHASSVGNSFVNNCAHKNERCQHWRHANAN